MSAVNSYFVKIQGVFCKNTKHKASQMLLIGARVQPLLWVQEGTWAAGQREVAELLCGDRAQQ